jgi:cobalt-zinc-cadmium efflux system outer membrane protein
VRAREARALQAGLLPNPELDVEVENFAGTGETRGFDATETTLSLGQLIETAGKRPKRRRAAELDAEVASWEYELVRVELFARVVQAFVDVLAGQERLALAQELVRVAEESAQATARLVRAGAASPVEGTRAAVAVATRKVELETARRELEGARARLAATWGARSAQFERAEGELGAVEVPPPLEALKAQLEQNPLLERWSREIARREAVVGLEQARRIPNVVLAGGLRRLSETNDNALVVGVTVPLPLFDRNQGARAAARSDLRKAHHERRAAEVNVHSALETAYQELLARFREATDLGEEILPKAQEAFDGVRSGYLRGLFRNVDVLQAQETLFELRLRELDALRAYGNAVAEIERLTGAPLHRAP